MLFFLQATPYASAPAPSGHSVFWQLFHTRTFPKKPLLFFQTPTPSAPGSSPTLSMRRLPMRSESGGGEEEMEENRGGRGWAG